MLSFSSTMSNLQIGLFRKIREILIWPLLLNLKITWAIDIPDLFSIGHLASCSLGLYDLVQLGISIVRVF